MYIFKYIREKVCLYKVCLLYLNLILFYYIFRYRNVVTHHKQKYFIQDASDLYRTTWLAREVWNSITGHMVFGIDSIHHSYI